MGQDDLRGRTALVTGCNRMAGIGAAIARVLMKRGATVEVAVEPERCPAGRDEEPEAGQDTVKRIIAAGGAARLLAADLADPDQCLALIGRAEEVLGPVDVLVNNAAHSEPDSVFAGGTDATRADRFLTAASLDAHYAVNVRAPALLMSDFCARLAARGTRWGRVVNISTDGSAGFPGEVSYGATKSALESLSRAAAHEAAPPGATVNVVAPGPVQTGWITDDMLEDVARATPLGRAGTPEDVADVVAFLASEDARWITGQTLFVSGGHRMV